MRSGNFSLDLKQKIPGFLRGFCVIIFPVEPTDQRPAQYGSFAIAELALLAA
jgi:hypothetical protein